MVSILYKQEFILTLVTKKGLSPDREASLYLRELTLQSHSAGWSFSEADITQPCSTHSHRRHECSAFLYTGLQSIE